MKIALTISLTFLLHVVPAMTACAPSIQQVRKLVQTKVTKIEVPEGP